MNARLDHSIQAYSTDKIGKEIQLNISQHLITDTDHTIVSSVSVALSIEEAQDLIARLKKSIKEAN